MRRVISLFREPDELPGLSDRPPPVDQQPDDEAIADQPLYFVQLLDYLRQQKAAIDEDAVIGAERN